MDIVVFGFYLGPWTFKGWFRALPFGLLLQIRLYDAEIGFVV